MPNSLGNFAWGSQIPCSVGDTKNTEGVPKSLGDLTRGYQILRGAGSPMTGLCHRFVDGTLTPFQPQLDEVDSLEIRLNLVVCTWHYVIKVF